MSKKKTNKTVNKFTKSLDFNLGKLKFEKERLEKLAKRDNKQGLAYRGALQSVQNLEKKVNNLYGIVSGSQNFIKFSRTSNWSNPLNKLGIGPHSNTPVPNTFALSSKELESRYPNLFKEKGDFKGKKNTNVYDKSLKGPNIPQEPGSKVNIDTNLNNNTVVPDNKNTPVPTKYDTPTPVPYNPSLPFNTSLKIPTGNFAAYVEPHQSSKKNLKIGRA